MHVIMDHSMHDERNSTSFAHSNGKNRNIWSRFCIEHQTKVIYIQEFKNMMLSVYIFVEFSFLNGLQIKNQQIEYSDWRCQLCWQLPSIKIIYWEHISESLSKNTFFMYLDVQLQ